MTFRAPPIHIVHSLHELMNSCLLQTVIIQDIAGVLSIVIVVFMLVANHLPTNIFEPPAPSLGVPVIRLQETNLVYNLPEDGFLSHIRRNLSGSRDREHINGEIYFHSGCCSLTKTFACESFPTQPPTSQGNLPSNLNSGSQ